MKVTQLSPGQPPPHKPAACRSTGTVRVTTRFVMVCLQMPWGKVAVGSPGQRSEALGPTMGQSFNFQSLSDGDVWQLTQPRQRHLTLCWEATGIWYMWDKAEHTWAFFPVKFSGAGSPWLVISHMQDLQFCLSEDCETELLSSLIRNQVNSSSFLLAGGKKKIWSNSSAWQKMFHVKVLLQFQISETFRRLFLLRTIIIAWHSLSLCQKGGTWCHKTTFFCYSLACSFSLQHYPDHFAARQDLALKLSQVWFSI